MNQEITISLNTFDYLDANLPTFEKNYALDIFKLLKENKFVTDSKYEHAQQIWARITKLTDEKKKKKFQELLGYLINYQKSLVNCTYSNEFTLASESDDKIFLEPTLDNKDVKQIQKNHFIEAHNAKSFVFPEIFHKLKHSEAILRFEKDIPYDLAKILSPYLRRTEKITIVDPFLPNKSAINNFHLILNATNCKNIEVTTLKEKDYIFDKNEQNETQKKELYNYFCDSIESLRRIGYSIKKDEYKQRNHKERFIFTDLVRITLPGGLDFLNIDGMLTNGEDREIRVDNLNKLS